MSNRVKLDVNFVKAAAPPEAPKDRIIYWDEAKPGFGLMVTNKGHRSFVIQYRVGHRSRRMHLDNNLTLDAARRQATKLLGAKADNRDPLEEKRKEARKADETFRAIAEEYIKREKKTVRSMGYREATLKQHVYPKFGPVRIDDIKRAEIVRLLDNVEDKAGPSAADNALRIMRRIFSWHASRSEFRSPIVRGMARTKPKERARERTLTDDEIRAVWAAAEADKGLFGPYVQFLLCTGARRTEASAMTKDELSGAVWTIPGKRHKTGREQVIPLSTAAQTALARLPKFEKCDFIFTTDGKTPFSGYSKAKAKFDKACGVTGWTLHDVRRTARTLLSRAGVDPDIAERCLTHTIGGVRGVYDRHAYFEEKKRAFEALASAIKRVLNPLRDNVIALAREA